ncbi:MAG: DUF3786 domain-containing protein [Deltaproteobacteria bacterium]|uniref:DUF3786 domain-containing protein n=1 Tax=Desulfobacula sp. TaxID=2593537 RepID=UPI0019AF1B60|nr:DUF3786 domain-containing protein [Candidatus Desulfobacula maris]MBL6993639.1 DUF3786 domain-containing protein [Desulfobacula sp.]
MSNPKNVMEIFKYLEKSNCRECGEKTCLAFASAVFQSRKKIDLCPHLDPGIIEKYTADNSEKSLMSEQMGEQLVGDLKKSLSQLDFQKISEKSGGKYDGKALTLKVLGKDFGVRPDGTFKTDIHVNTWITGPFLDYLIQGQGEDPSGYWISFRELKESDDLIYSFFKKRCEAVMKRIADDYTDLFDDLVHIFGGKRVEEQFEADISVVLHPLPKVPIMVCYLEPEDGMPSTLNLFFDRSIDANLSIDSVLTLCAGFSAMIERITEKHGVIAI